MRNLSCSPTRRRSMPKVAVYPGSFDPITNGHLDVIQRAAAMFDQIIIACAHNPEKSPMFTPEQRLDLVRTATLHLSNVSVEDFQMALLNRKLEPKVETIFLMPKDEYTFISSRLVKEIAGLGGDVSKFVPA